MLHLRGFIFDLVDYIIMIRRNRNSFCDGLASTRDSTDNAGIDLTLRMANPLGSKDRHTGNTLVILLLFFFVQNALRQFQIFGHPSRGYRRSLKNRTWSDSFPDALSILALSAAVPKSDRLPGKAPH